VVTAVAATPVTPPVKVMAGIELVTVSTPPDIITVGTRELVTVSIPPAKVMAGILAGTPPEV
jgi:hypothetical protein